MTASFTQRQDSVPREHRVHDAGNYIIDIYTHTKELPNVMTVPCLCSARHDSARTVQTLFANMESVSSVRQFVEGKVMSLFLQARQVPYVAHSTRLCIQPEGLAGPAGFSRSWVLRKKR